MNFKRLVRISLIALSLSVVVPINQVQAEVTCLTQGAIVERPNWDSINWTDICKSGDTFDFILIIEGGKKFRVVGSPSGVRVSNLPAETSPTTTATTQADSSTAMLSVESATVLLASATSVLATASRNAIENPITKTISDAAVATSIVDAASTSLIQAVAAEAAVKLAAEAAVKLAAEAAVKLAAEAAVKLAAEAAVKLSGENYATSIFNNKKFLGSSTAGLSLTDVKELIKSNSSYRADERK